ncbi:acetylglutamate kinase [Proteiniborus sp. MB09-C3]|uniref:acetylglutamate kinase n=1 Tax=Proteiniborus sp. MB09-C3 TaxID=3050072 RepID=UPI0025530720|nr:acetylglutamate kinase [Proteiniborus sp. MB09-C3]WIV12666.1 acetylglutamate kinase [Proteiniborus sp. MB09-C3]
MYTSFNCICSSAVNLINHIRMLWEQHGAWTRMAIISIVFGLPDEDPTVKRLLRNPTDFANALRPFYGDIIATRFEKLLTYHLTIAAELIKAAKAGDSQKAEDAEKRWYKNADDIAALLGYINPYWSEKNWREMLHEHLAFVKAEAVYMLNKEYQKSIDTYDKMEIQILQMADMMAKGIICQFACYFCC